MEQIKCFTPIFLYYTRSNKYFENVLVYLHSPVEPVLRNYYTFKYTNIHKDLQLSKDEGISMNYSSPFLLP